MHHDFSALPPVDRPEPDKIVVALIDGKAVVKRPWPVRVRIDPLLIDQSPMIAQSHGGKRITITVDNGSAVYDFEEDTNAGIWILVHGKINDEAAE